MRWYIVKTLLWKEMLRQGSNRGGMALAALLVVAALLMTFFGQDGNQAGTFAGSVDRCYVDYWRPDGWVEHLRANQPPELQGYIKFRDMRQRGAAGEVITYPISTGAIQMRPLTNPGGSPSTKIWIWEPSANSLAPFEAWFWRESACYFQQQAPANSLLAKLGPGEIERSQLKGGFDMRLSITSALVLFALFFSCVYLLPSMMCEERECGVLLAQALSPASAVEILAAKFLFYPAIGIILASTLAGISKPQVLAQVFFWLVVVVAAFGSLGIGLTIACLAKTQRTASMGALCYLLVLTMILFICQQGNIPVIPFFALEYHCPRMLHAALGNAVHWFHWVHLVAAAALALTWATMATILFRQRGWQ